MTAEPTHAPGLSGTDASSSTAEQPDVELDDLDVDGLAAQTPPLIDADGRVRLSFSRIDMFQNCPRKFRYAYVDRLPTRPAPALSFGSSVHAALEAFYDQKLPEPPSEDALLTFLYDHWEHAGFADLERDEQVAYYRHAQDVLRRYHRRAAPTYRLPVATEAWFELPIDDEAIVVGSIDRVDRDDDGNLHVIDYKTNRRAQPRQRVAKSLQLAIYARACEHLYGRLPASVGLVFVVAGVDVAVDIEEIDLAHADAVIRETAASIRAGIDHPTPNRLCDWCDFRDLCPAWSSDVDALGPAVERASALRRQLRRDAAELRAVESAIERLQVELAEPDAGAPVGDGGSVAD
ncbi:MAG: PD-(D/E)XK nuclease family protein [Nitriliruptoraceae bacterium]